MIDEIQELPIDINDTIDLNSPIIIRTKDDVGAITKTNFGNTPYILTYTEDETLRQAAMKGNMRWEELIRLFPIDEKTGVISDKCHMLMTLMLWKDIRDKFEIIGYY